MPLRDLVLTFIIFGSVPFILMDPFWGVLAWNWLAFMNPHRYTWGFASDFRFSLIIAAATLISFVLNRGESKIPWRVPTVLMVALTLWVSVTTIKALNPAGATEEWNRFVKIIAMILLSMAVLDSRRKLEWLIWVVVLSLGFFGFKGGIFTIMHGGVYAVGGPPGSFIAGNNEIAFALIMTLPLMRYLQLSTENKKIRRGLSVLMLLCGFSIVGSYSRGALLAGMAMVLLLWLRSRRKPVLAIALLVVIPLLFAFMPSQWHERMDTIENYQEDASAMGRINAWRFAWNLALDNPVLGGGARVFTPQLFMRYAPEPERVHDAHSIYFEMLAEQGFVGLGIFLCLGFATFANAAWLRRATRNDPRLRWAFDLGSMCQTSLVGYAVGGAFLGLSYFDLPYTIVAIVVVTRVLVERELAIAPEKEAVWSAQLPSQGEVT